MGESIITALGKLDRARVLRCYGSLRREMLRHAKAKIEIADAAERVSWVEGRVENSPRELFDAATAFLVLAFVLDDGNRLNTLKSAWFFCHPVRHAVFRDTLSLSCRYGTMADPTPEIP